MPRDGAWCTSPPPLHPISTASQHGRRGGFSQEPSPAPKRRASRAGRSSLRALEPALRVRRKYPLRGKGDGLTRACGASSNPTLCRHRLEPTSAALRVRRMARLRTVCAALRAQSQRAPLRAPPSHSPEVALMKISIGYDMVCVPEPVPILMLNGTTHAFPTYVPDHRRPNPHCSCRLSRRRRHCARASCTAAKWHLSEGLVRTAALTTVAPDDQHTRSRPPEETLVYSRKPLLRDGSLTAGHGRSLATPPGWRAAAICT